MFDNTFEKPEGFIPQFRGLHAAITGLYERAVTNAVNESAGSGLVRALRRSLPRISQEFADIGLPPSVTEAAIDHRDVVDAVAAFGARLYELDGADDATVLADSELSRTYYTALRWAEVWAAYLDAATGRVIGDNTAGRGDRATYGIARTSMSPAEAEREGRRWQASIGAHETMADDAHGKRAVRLGDFAARIGRRDRSDGGSGGAPATASAPPTSLRDVAMRRLQDGARRLAVAEAVQ